jgi:hypothetical protein
MGEGVSKNIKNCVTSFMNDPLATFVCTLIPFFAAHTEEVMIFLIYSDKTFYVIAVILLTFLSLKMGHKNFSVYFVLNKEFSFLDIMLQKFSQLTRQKN